MTLFFSQLRIESGTDWLLQRGGISNVIWIGIAIVAFIGSLKTREALRRGQSDEFTIFASNKGFSFERGGERVMPMLSHDPLLSYSAESLLGIPGRRVHPILEEFGQEFRRLQYSALSEVRDENPPYAQSIMRGRDRDGVNWAMFQHVRQNSSVTWCLIAESPVLLPIFSMTPETAADRAAKSLGKRELQVENQAFNNRYFIETDEPERVLHLLHPQAIDRLMYLIPAEWEFSPRYIMVCLPGTASSQNLETYYNSIKDFIRLIPGYYRKDFGFPNLP